MLQNDRAFIASAVDFSDAGPNEFKPGYEQYRDLALVAQRVAALASSDTLDQPKVEIPATDMVLVPREKLTEFRDVMCGDWCKPEKHVSECAEATAMLAATPELALTAACLRAIAQITGSKQ